VAESSVSLVAVQDDTCHRWPLSNGSPEARHGKAAREVVSFLDVY